MYPKVKPKIVNIIAATIMIIPCVFLPLLIVKAPNTIPAGPKIIGNIINDKAENTHPRIMKTNALLSFGCSEIIYPPYFYLI